jgi:hypothetical protein
MATVNTITIPDDFIWPDEYEWSPVVATAPIYTLGGNMKIHTGVRNAGRPITLTGNENWFLVDRATVDALKALENQAGIEMTLTFNAALRSDPAMTVIFRHWEGGIEAIPWIDYADPAADDLYQLTLRFMQVL